MKAMEVYSFDHKSNIESACVIALVIKLFRLMTDCVNNGSYASARFVPSGERLNIPMHICSIHHEACKTLLLQGIIHFIVYILRVFQYNDFLSQK